HPGRKPVLGDCSRWPYRGSGGIMGPDSPFPPPGDSWTMNPTPHPVSRRGFLKSAAALAAGSALPAWMVEESRSYAQPQPPTSPNDRPHVALIGCGGMGRGDIQAASKFGTVVALCDVDDSHARQAAEAFKGATVYKDFRKLLERNDVHVIVNATPDHWH